MKVYHWNYRKSFPIPYGRIGLTGKIEFDGIYLMGLWFAKVVLNKRIAFFFGEDLPFSTREPFSNINIW